MLLSFSPISKCFDSLRMCEPLKLNYMMKGLHDKESLSFSCGGFFCILLPMALNQASSDTDF